MPGTSVRERLLRRTQLHSLHRNGHGRRQRHKIPQLQGSARLDSRCVCRHVSSVTARSHQILNPGCTSAAVS